MYIRERFFMGFFYNAIKDWKAFARDLRKLVFEQNLKKQSILFCKKTQRFVQFISKIVIIFSYK